MLVPGQPQNTEEVERLNLEFDWMQGTGWKQMAIYQKGNEEETNNGDICGSSQLVVLSDL